MVEMIKTRVMVVEDITRVIRMRKVRKKDDRSNKGDNMKDENKGGEQVRTRKSGRQQALNTIDSTLTTKQDSISRVDVIGDASKKSKSMTFATVLPLRAKTTDIMKSSVYFHRKLQMEYYKELEVTNASCFQVMKF